MCGISSVLRLFLILFAANSINADCPIIKTEKGDIQGIEKSVEGKTYCAYQNIKYAKNPTDYRRFQVCCKTFIKLSNTKQYH